MQTLLEKSIFTYCNPQPTWPPALMQLSCPGPVSSSTKHAMKHPKLHIPHCVIALELLPFEPGKAQIAANFISVCG